MLCVAGCSTRVLMFIFFQYDGWPPAAGGGMDLYRGVHGEQVGAQQGPDRQAEALLFNQR